MTSAFEEKANLMRGRGKRPGTGRNWPELAKVLYILLFSVLCILNFLITPAIMIHKLVYLGVAFAAAAAAHGDGDHTQEPIAGPHKSLWYNTLPGDGGTQVYFGR